MKNIMKNKIITIIILIVVVIVLAGGIVYYIKQNKPMSGIGITENNQTANEEQLPNKIVTDDFSITLPIGWSKTTNTVPGVLALAANPNEKINDEAAEKINFKSYLAISSEALSGKNLEEYMQSTKNEIQATISGTIFSNENALIINNRSARAVEAEMTQQGVDFKVLMVVINGNRDSVWVLSYNTTKNDWAGYKDHFAESAKSFIIKSEN